MHAGVIVVEGLRKSYGDLVAVDDVSLEVAGGEIFGILGPNGSGKTTTVECLQGLRSADGGRIAVLGLDPRTNGAELRRRIGSQLQESALPDRMRVWEALDLFGALAADPVDTDLLLEQWGLGGKRNAAFANLSGGQRQRLFVALALVNNPALVFLDEMTTGLDPAARRTAWELIEAIRDRGATVVLVTHFMDEAERLCDRLAVIRSGRVVASGTPQELVAQHGSGARVSFSIDASDLTWLEDVRGVRDVVRRGGRAVVSGDGPLLAYVAAELVARGYAPEDLQVERSSLEEVFLHLVDAEPAR
ncbi:MAG: ABC transporter ATP-binding protein [Actinomycetota bacterium]